MTPCKRVIALSARERGRTRVPRLSSSALLSAILLVAAAVSAVPLGAQTCFGTPPRGGLAVDHGRVNFGSTNGISGAVVGKRVAFGLGGRMYDRGSQVDGYGADTRFAVVLGGKRNLQICPGLGLGYAHDTWKSSLGELSSDRLTGWVGLGAGYEAHAYRDIRLIPFASLRYAYRAVKYDIAVTSGDVTTTGDTVSAGEVQFGLLVRYKLGYAGYIVDHPMKEAPATLARWVLGLTFADRVKRR